MAIKEINVQTKVVKAVVEHGGFAKKMSHRFLVGVPDLMVKLPDLPVALVEVKFDEHPKKSLTYTTEITHPQRAFLRESRAAGIPSLVLTVLRSDTAYFAALSCVDRFGANVRLTNSLHDYVLLKPFDKAIVQLFAQTLKVLT